MDAELVWIIVIIPALLAVTSAVILLVVKTPARMDVQRKQAMRRLADRLGMRYLGDAGDRLWDLLPRCSVLQRGKRKGIANILTDGRRPARLLVFDYRFTRSPRDSDGTFSAALYLVVMVYLEKCQDLPRVRLYKKDWFGGPVGVDGTYRLEWEDDPMFGDQFVIARSGPARMREMLTEPVRAALKEWDSRGPLPVVETTPGWLIVYAESDPGGGRLEKRGAQIVRYAMRIAESLPRSPAC